MNAMHLNEIPLFKEMTDAEIKELLNIMHSIQKHFGKNDIILHAGSTPGVIGIVLSGSVTVLSDDVWGNRSILSHIEAGGLFGEAYALLPEEPMLVDVEANESCNILLLHPRGIINSSDNNKQLSYKFIRNLLLISSRKNLILSGRNFHTSPKTIRGRVMSYLNSVSLQKNSIEFDIPFDRQQLADYLNLERSALSKELGKMQKEGIITTRKNHFRLITRNN